MAHPKSKISKQRKRKRRTHKKLGLPTISICGGTDMPHLRHRAHSPEPGKWYHKGKLVIDTTEGEAEAEN